MRTLEVLQSQSLLGELPTSNQSPSTIQTNETNTEGLVPFDLESTWSAAVVLLVAHAVDPSLLRNVEELRNIAYAILSEMVARGNRVASFYKEELELLEHHLRELASSGAPGTAGVHDAGAGPSSNSNSESTTTGTGGGIYDSTGFSTAGGRNAPLQEWYFDDNMIDGEQLMRAANSLDLDAFQWYADDGAFESLDASLL
jgi:hypothetical protein